MIKKQLLITYTVAGVNKDASFMVPIVVEYSQDTSVESIHEMIMITIEKSHNRQYVSVDWEDIVIINSMEL